MSKKKQHVWVWLRVIASNKVAVFMMISSDDFNCAENEGDEVSIVILFMLELEVLMSQEVYSSFQAQHVQLLSFVNYRVIYSLNLLNQF